MKELSIPHFKTYEEEAAFWDTLDTADFMGEDESWFQKNRLRRTEQSQARQYYPSEQDF